MNRIVKHNPNFCTVSAQEEATFTDVKSLLAVPFVALWAEFATFYQFSQSSYGAYRTNLIAELRDGTEWWVVGYMDDPLPEDQLPRWKPETPTLE